MTARTAIRSFVLFALASLLIGSLAVSIQAYTGGPTTIQIEGYCPDSSRVYYRQWGGGETGNPPRVYYLDLTGGIPEQRVRAAHLEESPKKQGVYPLAWSDLQHRLIRLRALDHTEFSVRVDAESTGVSKTWQVVTYTLAAAIRVGDSRREMQLEAFCDSRISVEGVYAIPGRPERLVVVTYVGVEYSCESVETLILMQPGDGH